MTSTPESARAGEIQDSPARVRLAKLPDRPATTAKTRAIAAQAVKTRREDVRVRAGLAEMAVTRYPGTGHPLVLINGLGAHQRMWDPLVAGLTESQVTTFDFPGLGRSHVLGAPVTVRRFVDLVEELVTKLGYDKVDVLGYSFGGMVAQELAHSRPDLVRRLALVATAPGVGAVPGHPSAMFALATPMRYYSRRFYKWTSRFLAGGEVEKDPEFMERSSEIRKLYRPHPWTYYGQIFAAQTWTSLPWLGNVQAPTLVVHGTDDPIIPHTNGEIMAQRIPNARLFTAAAEGHLLMQDENTTAIPAIDSFFASGDHTKSGGWTEAHEVTAAMVRNSAFRADMRAAQPLGLYNQAFRNSVEMSRAMISRGA